MTVPDAPPGAGGGFAPPNDETPAGHIHSPRIVGIGGTARAGSSTEQALSLALAAAETLGADVTLFGAATLARLPLYLTATTSEDRLIGSFIDAIRSADGVVIASPGYHGSISGMVKNAIDYIEETARDGRPYLDGVPVGLIATAYGWQATVSTLAALRSVVHALRGWPTPLGAAINTTGGPFADGVCSDDRTAEQLRIVGEQVYAFASLRSSQPGRPPPSAHAQSTSAHGVR